ncbi:MAG: glycosyltransferase [Patescibacteria group bacterium]
MKIDNRTPHEIISKPTEVPKFIISLSVVFTLIYFTWWLDFNNAGNILLYSLLFIGEVYHVLLALGYAYTIWDQKKPRLAKLKEFPKVAIMIVGSIEPPEVVENILKAATELDYPNYEVYFLNDGYVFEKTKKIKTPWQENNEVAKKYGVTAVTRQEPGGAKSGNVNNALNLVDAPFIALFDTDHVPRADFLTKTMGFFKDEKVAFVQTPQYYQNKDNSFLTTAAWEQQELFFGPICRGKVRMNATFCCGTNFVARKSAVEEVGGFPEDNIAEDFIMSYYLHSNGWKSIYWPEVLAEGMAPHNLQDYAKQQYRWARGSLEIILKHNPLLNRKLTWGQKVQYLYSSGYWLNGIVILIDALIPVIALSTGLMPVNQNSTNFMIYFFPFMFSTLYLLMMSTHNTITFRAIQMSMSSFYIMIKAVVAVLFNKKDSFDVTPKDAQEGNFLKLAIPHITYITVGVIAIGIGIAREGLIPSVVTNIAWIIFNSIFFFGFIRAGYNWNKLLNPVYSYSKSKFLFRVKEKHATQKESNKALIFASNEETTGELEIE